MITGQESTSLGTIAAFMSSVTWATGVLAYSRLSSSYPAYIINLHRILIGFPAACLMLTLMGGWQVSLQAMNVSLVGWAVIVVLSSYALGDALFLMATKHIGAPAALAIASIYPLWSALWGALLERQALDFTKLMGVLLIVAGVVAVILSGAKNEDLVPASPVLYESTSHSKWRKKFWKSQRFLGVMLAMFASFGWAMNAIAVAKLGVHLNAMFVNVLRLGIALVLCPVIGVMMNGKRSFRLISRKAFLPFLPAFAFECICGPFFFVYGLSHASLAIGSTLSSLAPAISVPVAVALGHERFSKLKTSGVCAVAVGTWLLLR